MFKKAGYALVLAGGILILCALLFMVYNDYTDHQAGYSADAILDEMKTVMTDGENQMILERDEFIGYVSIPSLDVELPVIADWDYEKLKKYPCRHFGAEETNDLVIAAHNYESHFGRLSELTEGDKVTFTDVNGKTYQYQVCSSLTVDPDEVDLVQNSGYDLVLYSCTPGWGTYRVVVFCKKKQ